MYPVFNEDTLMENLNTQTIKAAYLVKQSLYFSDRSLGVSLFESALELAKLNNVAATLFEEMINSDEPKFALKTINKTLGLLNPADLFIAITDIELSLREVTNFLIKGGNYDEWSKYKNYLLNLLIFNQIDDCDLTHLADGIQSDIWFDCESFKDERPDLYQQQLCTQSAMENISQKLTEWKLK